jgi:hypothetical protein
MVLLGKAETMENQKGEHSAIFYNSDKFKLLEENTFWLSETPEKPSKGWDAAYNRVCTYGLFQNKKTKRKYGYSIRILTMLVILPEPKVLNLF